MSFFTMSRACAGSKRKDVRSENAPSNSPYLSSSWAEVLCWSVHRRLWVFSSRRVVLNLSPPFASLLVPTSLYLFLTNAEMMRRIRSRVGESILRLGES